MAALKNNKLSRKKKVVLEGVRGVKGKNVHSVNKNCCGGKGLIHSLCAMKTVIAWADWAIYLLTREMHTCASASLEQANLSRVFPVMKEFR